MEPAVIVGIVVVVALLIFLMVVLVQRRRRQGSLKVTSAPSSQPAEDGDGGEAP